MTSSWKYKITLFMLAFSLPLLTVLSVTREQKMLWISVWSICYFFLNVTHDYNLKKKYKMRLMQEYALISILGIALLAGVIYYE